jgi:hypothetical protein
MIFLYIAILMMNSILNLFSGTNNNLTKPKANQKKKAPCRPKQSDIQSYMPSLQQGKKFEKYQGQIVKNLEKKIANMENEENADSIEGFQTGGHGLTKQTQQVINNNDFSSQKSSIANLKGQYQNTLREYEAAQDQVTGTSNDYFERVSSANPYLNKIIQFSTGQLFYVTAQGVAKYIPTNDIANTIDPSRKFIAINVKWNESYLAPGAKIPTKPNLLVGTPVQKGQRLGMEGENVFVSNTYTNPAAKYVGCYTANAGGTTAMPTVLAGFIHANYEQCKQAAANNGYKYFALTNVDYSTSTGPCVASNDKAVATSLGISTIQTGSTVVWSSNTQGESGNIATLSDTGSLSVVNTAGQSIFSTPNSTAQPSNYIGCYGDKAVRSMPFFNNGAQQYNLEQCQQIAKQNGSAYFGLQNSTSGTNAQCGLSNDLAQATKYGKAGNCTKIGDGSWSGGGWSNSVYNAKTPDSIYYLILQDDGNMCVYRGGGPEDNQGLIWASGTNGKIQSPNPSYAAAKGKYGKNWMATGATLSAGDFVGSNDGSIALVMQTDGNLVLNTYVMGSNCKPMADGNIGGGANGNAIYETDKQSYPKDLFKLAFIDPDSELRDYPSDNSQYSTSYTKMPNTYATNDIPNAALSADLKTCQTMCDSNPECSGFNYLEGDDHGNHVTYCMPKQGDLAAAISPTIMPGYDLYARNKTPKTSPAGASTQTQNIDSIMYNGYIAGGEVDTSRKLPTATPAQKAKLAKLQSSLDQQSQQLIGLTTQFDTGSSSAWRQSQKNIKGTQQYLNEFKSTNDKITTFSTNVPNILRDSDIVVLQKNYDYLFWSILATGTVLVAMNVVKK